MITRDKILVFIFVQIMILGVHSQFDSDEDSGSIEIPNRPENRQAHRAQNTKPNSDRQTFLHLLAKLMTTIKLSIQDVTKTVEAKVHRNVAHKTKKTLVGLRKAYSYAEKAKRHFVRHLLKE